MARCVIVSAVPLTEDFRPLLRADDYIIACDAGYLNCAKFEVVPQQILGDFDSAAQPKGDDACIVLPHEKDDTDTHYAAKFAYAQGYREVLLLGAIGGKRLEHTLGNLATGLWLAKQGVAVQLQDAYSRVSYVCAGQTRTLQKETADNAYFYFSVLPMEGCAEGVCIKGAAYEVDNATLTPQFPVGISNEFAKGAVTVSLEKGTLALIETKADGDV